MTKLISPVSIPGISSDMPAKVIFWLCAIPLSTWTSNIFRSVFRWAVLPCPPQESQWRWTCVIMPGPIWRISMTAPCPLHFVQVLTSPTMTSRLTANLTVFPLYKSSSDTLRGWLMLGPLRGPADRRREPPPKNMENKSSPLWPWPSSPTPFRVTRNGSRVNLWGVARVFTERGENKSFLLPTIWCHDAFSTHDTKHTFRTKLPTLQCDSPPDHTCRIWPDFRDRSKFRRQH